MIINKFCNNLIIWINIIINDYIFKEIIMSRISILDKDRCQPKKCDYLCIHYCPGVRMDEDTIVVDEDTKNR